MASQSQSSPSICIPRVFPNITWQRVKTIFEDLGLGTVDRVDMVNKTNDKGQRFKRVFVHFKNWNDNDVAQQVREKLLAGEQLKIIYDDPWFWKVAMSTAPRPDFTKRTPKKRVDGGKRQHKPKPPRLECDPTDTQTSQDAVKSAKAEMEELRRQIAEQKRELEHLKATSGTHTPDYSPGTPTYAPEEASAD